MAKFRIENTFYCTLKNYNPGRLLRLVVRFGVLLGMTLSLMALAREKKRFLPRPRSLDNLFECYPELERAGIDLPLQMSQIKQKIDSRFPTESSMLLYRVMVVKDPLAKPVEIKSPEGNEIRFEVLKRRIILGPKGPKEMLLRVEQMDLQGDYREVLGLQRLNPNPEIIAENLRGYIVESDTSNLVDKKGLGQTLEYTLINQIPQSFKLSDLRRMLRCEFSKPTGVVCTCSINHEK